MVSIDAATWRTRLARRLKDTSNVRWITADLDEAGQTAFPAVFPKYYKEVGNGPFSVTSDGYAFSSAPTTPSHVYDVHDASVAVTFSIGVPPRNGNQFYIKANSTAATSVVFYSYEPYDFPESGSETVEPEALELMLLHAMATCINQYLVDKANYERYDPAEPDRVDENELLALSDKLMSDFERRLDADDGMAYPAVAVV